MSSNMRVPENSNTNIEGYDAKASQQDNTLIPVISSRQRAKKKTPKTYSNRASKLIIFAVSAVEIVNIVCLYLNHSISTLKFICLLSALSLSVVLLIFISRTYLRCLIYLVLQSSLVLIQNFSSSEPSYISFLILMFASANTIIRTKLNFLAVHTVFISVYLFLNWFSISIIQNSVLGVAFALILSHRVVKSMKPEKYKEIPPSDMGELQSFIKRSSENLTDLMKEVPLRSHKKLIDVKNTLSQIMTLATSEHLYRAKIESITNDVEEIIYLQQNYNPPFIQSFSSYNCMDDYMEIENEKFLKNAGNIWNFDSFFLDECTGKPIESAANYIIKKFALNKHFGIENSTVSNFFRQVENQYLANPYHNAVHAADVLSSYMFLVKNSDLMGQMTTIETLAGVIANSAHDIAHPGYTNRFIINSKHPLAVRYNDISVLEMMHASKVFEILQEQDCNVLGTLQGEDWAFCRKLIIDMILATDVTRHFELLGQFKAKNTMNIQKQEERVLLYKLCIKAADIGHSAKNWNLHKKWTRGVIQEFFQQGDREKERQMPVSMFCDRDTTNVPKSQIGFIRNISLPLFQSLRDRFSSEIIHDNCVVQLVENLNKWEAKMIKKKISYEYANRNNSHLCFRKGFTDEKNDSNF